MGIFKKKKTDDEIIQEANEIIGENEELEYIKDRIKILEGFVSDFKTDSTDEIKDKIFEMIKLYEREIKKADETERPYINAAYTDILGIALHALSYTLCSRGMGDEMKIEFRALAGVIVDKMKEIINEY